MSMLDSLDERMIARRGNRYLEGNFAPVTVETTAYDLPIRGTVPQELSGRFVRIGPNPAGPIDPARYHWFTGAGMVHGLRLRDGKAEWYRNRYVVSERVAAVLGRPDIPGPRNGHGENTANTNIIALGGRTLAIVEAGGLPVELTFGLESVARSNLSGSLKAGFSAHPKRDPLTGRLHVLTYQPGLSALSYLVVDADGRAHAVADIDAPHCPAVHDVAFTTSSLVILDLPVVFNPARGGFPFAWDGARTPRVRLLPRDGDLAGLRWFEAPSCYVFHILNAYDDGETVVIDVVRHPRMFDSERLGPGEGDPLLVRWRLDRGRGKLIETQLWDRACEFPRLNEDWAGQDYRYGYTAAAEQAIGFGPAYKHDLKTGQTLVHDYGPGRQTLEPVFVARQGASAEDDGWLISYVYDAERQTSDVVILDARAFDAEPVAVIPLPVRVPFGFHGNWLADPAASQV
jgi:carotenoid cleavage dioxygenase